MKPSLIGISPQIIRIKELIRHVADTGLNILISGETGVGKEVVAQSLYIHSPRSKKPFVKINCAALPEGLLESELFGYERGAFTGAGQKKKGKFELANQGVLFLDEIGDMPLLLQSKLLHVLQSGEFAPLGSEKEIKTDTWIISATNHILEKEVKRKKFREDLYYRLNTIKIFIPPLRQRSEDIPHLVNYFFDAYAPLAKNRTIIRPDNVIMSKLLAYHWPGNVRQLQNVLKKVIVLGNWDEIISELESGLTNSSSPMPEPSSQSDLIIHDYLDLNHGDIQDLQSFSLKKIKKDVQDKVEKEVISYVLEKTGWNRSKAAKILKISYKTLLNKISDLNLSPPTHFTL